MRNDFRLVARILYLVTVPKSFTVASEVATMDFLRSSGLPIPNVCGYLPTSDNMVETEDIFMGFVDGTKLSDIWFDLGEGEIESVVRQLVHLEAKMMSVSFLAGGSLYYAQDLERVAGKPGIPLKDERFYISPDMRLPLWYGKGPQLDVDRGPCMLLSAFYFSRYSLELTDNSKQDCRIRARRNGQRGTGVSAAVRPTVVAVPAHQEGKLPNQERLPSDHIPNLQRYLRIASSLVPKDPPLSHFSIRHPNLQETNIVVSRSSACWTGNTPLSYPHFSLPVCPNACRTTMIISLNL